MQQAGHAYMASVSNFFHTEVSLLGRCSLRLHSSKISGRVWDWWRECFFTRCVLNVHSRPLAVLAATDELSRLAAKLPPSAERITRSNTERRAQDGTSVQLAGDGTLAYADPIVGKRAVLRVFEQCGRTA
jgi:hypothetical protein